MSKRATAAAVKAEPAPDRASARSVGSVRAAPKELAGSESEVAETESREPSAEVDLVEDFDLSAPESVPTELAEKAERGTIAEANLAKVTDEKTRFEASIKIASHVQSNIAHDLRTPLGAIRGYARMILDGRAGDTNDTQREYLRIITENTNRVIDIANWMSHFADLSGQPVAVRAFDLREVWAESVRAAEGLFSSKALTLTQRIPQESFEIIADREKLGFVFKEILSVAVKLSEAGSAITAEFSQGRQREVIVKIKAKASSIPTEALSGIFDHSMNTTGVSQTDKQRQMNLSSVHDVIGLHGGRLFVKSTPGEDCTFWFTLPNITLGGEDKSHEQTFNLGR